MAKNVTIDSTSCVIANGATVSSVITLQASKRLIGFKTPATFTSTAITFEQSSDGGATYQPVYNESTLYSITTSTSRYHRVNAEVFDGCPYLRLIGGTAEGGSRIITIVVGEN